MPESTTLPDLCSKCIKTADHTFQANCEFCEKIKLDERVFCELNQLAQEGESFKCEAFRPLLRVVSNDNNDTKFDTPRKPIKGRDITQYLESNKFKYKKALARQKLSRNPDAVMIDLKYHVAWNMVCRKNILADFPERIDCLQETLYECGEEIGGDVFSVFLCQDHIHVCVESNGEKSVEQIVNILKECSEKFLKEQFAQLSKETIWDDAYFAETML